MHREDNSLQVRNDITLLNQMISELEQGGELYKPTNYWKTYEKIFLPELRKQGLHDFRRRRYSVLDSFGATDTLIRGAVAPKIKFTGYLSKILNKILWGNPFFPLTTLTSGDPQWITEYFYNHVQKKFSSIGLDLTACPTSRFGNPEDSTVIGSNVWSFNHLNYCSMVADAAQHIKFHQDMVICELGPGMGRNIEILAHLFPSATFLLIDIPPQLYVANQYLEAVFGERVIPYREAIKLDPDSGSCAATIKGKIVLLPSWLMPKWSNTKIDLFWNCASFQEMEPSVVKNYLNLVKKMTPHYIYINALPVGNYWGEWQPGRGGTKERVLGRYYHEYLQDQFQLVVEYDTEYFLRVNDHKSYIFKKL